MAELPLPLEQRECPLLTNAPHLREQYNAVLTQLRDLCMKYPAVRAAERVADFVTYLRQVREKLTRRHYRVGFLGTTGTGKSTTFNNVLHIDPKDPMAPAQEGVAKATTSTPTRLHRADQYSLELRYLTQEEYESFRKQLCAAVDLNPAKSNPELLRELESMSQPPSRTGRPSEGVGDKTVLSEDIAALERFLRSYEVNVIKKRALVLSTSRDNRHRLSVPYEERRTYLNHPPDPEAAKESPNLLLREACIGLPNDYLPEHLEMIDLPGLGAKGIFDNIVTRSFLTELDGGLVFVRAERLDDIEIEKLFEDLKKFFRYNLNGRIWLVITKMDALGQTHWLGNAAGERLYDSIAQFLKRHKLAAQQICLVSNELHKMQYRNQQLPESEKLATMKVPLEQRPIPEKFRDDPYLRGAFEQLLHFGGIDYLRQLIVERLKAEVESQLRKEIEDTLRGLDADISKYREKLDNQPADLRPIRRCKSRVSSLRFNLQSPRQYQSLCEELADKLEAELLATFQEACEDRQRMLRLSGPELAEEFEQQSEALQECLKKTLAEMIVDPLYRSIGQEMSNLPAVRVCDASSVAEAWELFRRKDSYDLEWLDKHPELDFLCSDLFPARVRDRGIGLGGREYLPLMEEKIRVVSQLAVEALRMHLDERLEIIEKDLASQSQDLRAKTAHLNGA